MSGILQMSSSMSEKDHLREMEWYKLHLVTLDNSNPVDSGPVIPIKVYLTRRYPNDMFIHSTFIKHLLCAWHYTGDLKQIKLYRKSMRMPSHSPCPPKVRQKSQKSLTAIIESSMKDMVEKRKVRKDLLRRYYFGLDFKMRINRASPATLW